MDKDATGAACRAANASSALFKSFPKLLKGCAKSKEEEQENSKKHNHHSPGLGAGKPSAAKKEEHNKLPHCPVKRKHEDEDLPNHVEIESSDEENEEDDEGSVCSTESSSHRSLSSRSKKMVFSGTTAGLFKIKYR